MTEEEREESKKYLAGLGSLKILLISVARNTEGNSIMTYTGQCCMYETLIPELYEVLKLYGYQPDEEEQKFLDGTHELYLKGE